MYEKTLKNILLCLYLDNDTLVNEINEQQPVDTEENISFKI